jgi:hypothetical protein
MERRDDIKLEAKWPFILFGDGLLGQVVSMQHSRNVQGEDVWKMTILPSPELEKRYGISVQDEMNYDRTIDVEYPLEMVQQLSPDPAFPFYFCFLNYRGQDTDAVRYWDGKLQLDKIMSLKKLLRQKEAENAFLTERLKIAETNISEYYKKFIMGPATQLNTQLISQQMQTQQGPTYRPEQGQKS